MFLEFMVYNKVSHSSLCNHISAIRRKFCLFGLNTSPLEDQRIRYFNKAVARSAPLTVKFKAIIDIPVLIRIVHICDSIYMGFGIKTAILTSFFSFMCISNLVPHSIATGREDVLFGPFETGRGDVFFGPPGVLLLLKWSKTIQMRNSVHLLKIPAPGNSPICPVAALKKLVTLTP